jgi:hypothetical protein
MQNWLLVVYVFLDFWWTLFLFCFVGRWLPDVENHWFKLILNGTIGFHFRDIVQRRLIIFVLRSQRPNLGLLFSLFRQRRVHILSKYPRKLEYIFRHRFQTNVSKFAICFVRASYQHHQQKKPQTIFIRSNLFVAVNLMFSEKFFFEFNFRNLCHTEANRNGRGFVHKWRHAFLTLYILLTLTLCLPLPKLTQPPSIAMTIR